MNNFLQLSEKNILITGVANKKSIAYVTAKILLEQGAQIFFSVQNHHQKENVLKLFPQSSPESIFICNVENEEDVLRLGEEIKNLNIKISGFLHSIAFAPFDPQAAAPTPFHETKISHFFQAAHISWLSLITLSNALKESLELNASVVTISISNTKITSYGYLGPIKAALENSVSYLAKSFSEFSQIRFNAVCAGPLKTSASAGIPHYIENYLYAEKLTLRKQALKTEEVANTICFLLSPVSSGINAASLMIDAGINCNYFDQDIVRSSQKVPG